MTKLAGFKMHLTLVAVAAAAAAIFFSPYRAQRSIEIAALHGDTKTLLAVIDISAIRDNTAAWVQGQLSEVTPIFGSVGPVSVGQVLQVMGGAAYRAQLNRYMTLQLATRFLIATINGTAPRDTKLANWFPAKQSLLPMLPDRYRDFSHFEFWSMNNGIPVRVLLCRNYLIRWEMCGFEGKDFTASLADALAKLMNQAHHLAGSNLSDKRNNHANQRFKRQVHRPSH